MVAAQLGSSRHFVAPPQRPSRPSRLPPVSELQKPTNKPLTNKPLDIPGRLT